MNFRTNSAAQCRPNGSTRARACFTHPVLATSAAIAALLFVAATASAQVAPVLGMAEQFAILGNSAVTGTTGSGVVVSGDVGSSPTATISNFPPSTTATPFVVHYTNDGTVQQARIDANAAYAALASQGPGTVLPDNLATVGALTPGIYSFVSGAPDLPASATLTLNGNGVFIFNVSSSLTANVLSNVVGTADPCNVYWRVGSSATLNGSTFMGTVIADANITVGAAANLAGRALAGTGATGAVTMAGSGGNIVGGCSVLIPEPPAGGVALSKAFFPTAIAAGGASRLTIGLSNNNATASILTAPLVDVLPLGMVIAALPNASTTCGSGGPGGGLVEATAGGNSVSLSLNSTIPGGAPGVCTVTVNVTVNGGPGGVYVNTLAIGALQTNNGANNPSNPAPGTAVLTLSVPIDVPTLSEWSLILLATLLAVGGLAASRKQ